MLAAAPSALALIRFGGFHFFHGAGRGGSGAVWLILAIAAAVLIVWAVARVGRRAA